MKIKNKLIAIVLILILLNMICMPTISNAGNVGVRIDFKMKIIDEDGNPIENVRLSIKEAAVVEAQERVTDENGEIEPYPFFVEVPNNGSTYSPVITFIEIPLTYTWTDNYWAHDGAKIYPGWKVDTNGIVTRTWNQGGCSAVNYDKSTGTITVVCSELLKKKSLTKEEFENFLQEKNIRADLKDNIADVGKVLTITSTDQAENTSLTVSDALNALKVEGATITEVKDAQGNAVDLNSTALIGTGYKITTDQGEYTAIVYGDTTGDGEIDAADMKVVVDDFLGERQASGVNKIAGDIQKDGSLDAADIKIMIDSFLGDLVGSILKTDEEEPEVTLTPTPTPTPEPTINPQEQIGKNLANVVKIGDYVDYPVEYKASLPEGSWWSPTPDEYGYGNKWRVFDINKTTGVVSLVSAKCTFVIDINEYDYDELCNEYIKNQFATLAYQNDSQYGRIGYLNNTYATKTRAFDYTDVSKYLNINIDENYNSLTNEEYTRACNDDLINTGEQYGLWYCDEDTWHGNTTKYITAVWLEDDRGIYAMGNFPFGVRTVVELKSNLKISGGAGIEANPWKMTQ